MRNFSIIILILATFSCGCAAGSATAGYSLKAGTANELSQNARSSIIREIKDWVKDNFQKL